MSTGRAVVRTTRALHCNLNVRALAPAAAVYVNGLGLDIRMRSRPRGADSSALGIDTPTDSTVWFLYDHRGGRLGPAIELVQWDTPPTVGASYPNPTDVGMHALGFHVLSVVDTVDRLTATGATTTARSSPSVAAVVLDADGVEIDLVPNRAEEAGATLAHVRGHCGDLERTAQWYEALGLTRVGGVETDVWTGNDPSGGRIGVPMQRLTFGDPSGFELRLTTWPGTNRPGRAHQSANHRGLFRMALGVDDVEAAVAHARRDSRLEVGDRVYIPLPDTPLGGLWVAFLRDPDGVLVELVERPQ